ncbi:sensor histidine kinase [Desulfocurvus sp. DL9XJH121]
MSTDEYPKPLFHPEDEGGECPGAERARPIAERIEAKTEDYASYQFTEPQTRALNIFFDLVQEFDDEKDFLAICVMVPKIIFGLDCALYLVTKDLDLACKVCTGSAALRPGASAPLHPDRRDGHWYFPIRANPKHLEQLPFSPPEGVIGCLEVHPAERMQAGDSLFWEKFANRIGFQMHNRMMHDANRVHLRFIRNLAKDIGHNVIVPNMYFKLFFNRLKRSIDGLGELKADMVAASDPHGLRITSLHADLEAQFEEIASHYEQTSLYLETLLRQSHFEKGHYVLERRPCDVARQIIDPQLHHFLPRFEEQSIAVDGCPGPEVDAGILMVDVGLLAQVYSNLFSNALKYTGPPPDGQGRKRISCTMRREKNAFGPGQDGILFGVFTTGKPIPEDKGARLFEAGVRGDDANLPEGSGHGLFFVRQIVELHGGRAGHAPRADGNEFHILLPCAQPEARRPGGRRP